MRNTGLEETQAGIKISGRNINNFRYADDTTLMAESEEELKRRRKKPKISRRKEIIKIWAEINEKEVKEIIVKIIKTKCWFFEKINKTDKPLARLIKELKKREESNQQNEKWKRRGYNR